MNMGDTGIVCCSDSHTALIDNNYNLYTCGYNNTAILDDYNIYTCWTVIGRGELNPKNSFYPI